jgi:hypothetical protein
MPKARLRLVVSAAAVLAAFTLAACGDSNNGGSSADEAQITKAIQAAATSGDPGACTQYQTQRFTAQTSDGTGQAAIKSCERDAGDAAADEVDVTDIEVDGDNATAKAEATGSVFDGQTLDIALVKENGQWKLDEFKGFEDFDREAMVNAFRTELAKQPGTTPQAIACVVQQFQSASDEELEGIFTGDNPDAEQRIFEPCSKFFQG